MSIEVELTKIIDDLSLIAYRTDKMDVSNTEHALDLIVDRLKAARSAVCEAEAASGLARIIASEHWHQAPPFKFTEREVLGWVNGGVAALFGHKDGEQSSPEKSV